MTDQTLPPNWKYIGSSFYIVRTQAGLEQAMRHFRQGERDKLRVSGYPKKYPAVICLSFGYAGYDYIRVECIHVKTMKAALEGQ